MPELPTMHELLLASRRPGVKFRPIPRSLFVPDIPTRRTSRFPDDKNFPMNGAFFRWVGLSRLPDDDQIQTIDCQDFSAAGSVADSLGTLFPDAT